MELLMYSTIPLIIGWILDKWLGDPEWFTHPVVLFGKIISKGEKHLNKGNHRQTKGAFFAFGLIILVFVLTYLILLLCSRQSIPLHIAVASFLIFSSLAGKTLIVEVKNVFKAVDRSVEEGREQVARIVGRDTSQLNAQQIRTAALETLAENLSDGVIAPLFWFAILGVPGMVAYKMVNTLDSMIGYKSERYKEFGCWAAHIDDVANYIPARLTALLMVIISGKLDVLKFVKKYARNHASPNSGYPESALAGILNCRFGGPNVYFGKVVEKPFIGEQPKELTSEDMKTGVSLNAGAEALMILITLVICLVKVGILSKFYF